MGDSSDKKQRSGLGGVRPGEFAETRFKELAQEMGISQSRMFETIFYSYLADLRSEKKEKALGCESELELIGQNLDHVANHIRSIVSKAQSTILSHEDSARQTNETNGIRVQTLNSKIEELSIRNEELEGTNLIFTEIKAGLDDKIASLSAEAVEHREKQRDADAQIKEQDHLIKSLEKQVENAEREVRNLKMENTRLSDEAQSKTSKIAALETSFGSLHSTIEQLTALKNAEVEAVKAAGQREIQEYTDRIRRMEVAHTQELADITARVRMDMESTHRLEVAKLTLEIAKIKEKAPKK